MAHKFLAFLEAVRLAFDVNNGAVMQDTIQDSGGNGDVGKDLVPLGEGLIGSEDGGGLLIASGNQLEKQISALNVHGEIADFVDNQHPVLGQHFELVRQAVFIMRFFELLNELVAIDVVSGKEEPGKDCVKENKRHPFSQELGQRNNLIERMYYYEKDAEGNAEGICGQPEVQ